MIYTPEIFEEEHLLNFNHIDNHGRARPSTVFDVMQDVATSDAVRLGVDKDTLHIIWALSRMKVTQTRELYPEDKITVRTVCNGVKGVTWCRSFTLLCGDEEIAKAYSTWAMLEDQTHRILRPAALPPHVPQFPTPDKSFVFPGKLSCDTMQPHHVHTVRYSDLDRNNHLNNAKIVDIIADALDFDQHHDKFIREIQVNYQSECVCGEQIILSVGQDTEQSYVFGTVDKLVKFEAALKLRDIRQKGAAKENGYG